MSPHGVRGYVEADEPGTAGLKLPGAARRRRSAITRRRPDGR